MTSFLSQLNGNNVLPGHIIVLAIPVGFVGPAKNILIHMTSIGKQFPEHTISILDYFFQSMKIAKNTLELSLIKVTSRNYWLKGHCLSDKQRSWIKDSQGNNKQLKSKIKTIYFLAKKKWAVKNNSEETIKYLANLGVDDIFQHINNAPKNSTYISTFSAEQFLKAVGDFLSDQIMSDLIAAVDFMILADESTDKADRSQMSVFLVLLTLLTISLLKDF